MGLEASGEIETEERFGQFDVFFRMRLAAQFWMTEGCGQRKQDDQKGEDFSIVKAFLLGR